jgi:hypothetical protein
VSSNEGLSARGRLAEAAAEIVELIKIAERDADFAAFAGMSNRHLRAERKTKLLLKGERVRGGLARRPPRTRRSCGILPHPLNVPNSQPLRENAVRNRVGLSDREQGAGVPGRDPATRKQYPRMLRQLGQPQRVGDVTAAFPDNARDFALRMAVLGSKLGVACSLFERVEIGPLDVLDNSDFERLAVAGLEHDDWDLVLSSPLGRTPSPLAGNNLISICDTWDGTNEDRLYDSALPDRRGQLLEFGLVEPFARIARVGAQKLNRRLAGATRQGDRLRLFARGAQKGRKPSTEAGPMFGSGGVFGH